MPETIDGVVYPTTPGGRPYPTAASPGKALWQLLERAMREVDDHETDTAAQLAAMQALINTAVSGQAPVRRLLTISATPTPLTVPGSQSAPTAVPWVSDTTWGGDVTTSEDRDKLPLSSDGTTLTIKTAGLYAIDVDLGVRGGLQVAIQKNSSVLLSTMFGPSDNSDMQITTRKVARLAVNDTLRVLWRFWVQSASGNYNVNQSANSGANEIYNLRQHFSVVRLGA